MKDIEELRNGLCELFHDLKVNKRSVPVGKEMNNAAGKIIATTKAQLEAAALAKITPNIPFLKLGT